jgi:hypothetical protein
MASYTVYDIVNNPRAAHEECYLHLGRMFDHFATREPIVRSVALDLIDPPSGWSYVEIWDALVLETSVVGAHGANSTTVNVVSTENFPVISPNWDCYFSGRGRWMTYTGKTATSFTGCGGHPALVDGEPVLAQLKTRVVGVHAADSTTINVDSTGGWEESGSFKMYDNSTGYDFEVTYTGKTATSFTGCGAHASTTGGEEVYGPPPIHLDEAAHYGLTSVQLVVE